MKKRICVICGKPFEGYGNNPSPLATTGVCCDKCNFKVVQARLKLLKEKEVKDNTSNNK